MSEDRTSQQLALRNGFKLVYAEYGDPAGRPVLYCHGSPGSRLDLANRDAVFDQANVRLIAPDRPGIGLSDFVAGYQLLDWPGMLIELADELVLDRFAVLGLSGGGPFTAACAFKIPERLTKAAIVSGIGYFDAPGAEQGMALLASMSDALRLGTQGAAHEWSLYVRPWGFRLGDITGDVHLWHGEADMNAPVAMGRQIARDIPNCSVRFIPGEGHISLFANHMEEILLMTFSDPHSSLTNSPLLNSAIGRRAGRCPKHAGNWQQVAREAGPA